MNLNRAALTWFNPFMLATAFVGLRLTAPEGALNGKTEAGSCPGEMDDPSCASLPSLRHYQQIEWDEKCL